MEIQKRLGELGFFTGPVSGKWEPLSKRALSDYKSQAGLAKNDLWDATTEQSLFGEGAPHAVRTLSFVGGWSVTQGECGAPGELAPLRITRSGAMTEGGACQFNSVKPDGIDAWRIDATCTVSGRSHQAHIRLVLRGAVLHWTSEEPETIYYRCDFTR